jgi:hypothetical protein
MTSHAGQLRPPESGADEDRTVDLSDDFAGLPTQTRDDTDSGWGELPASNDDRLLDERPPHWA